MTAEEADDIAAEEKERQLKLKKVKENYGSKAIDRYVS